MLYYKKKKSCSHTQTQVLTFELDYFLSLMKFVPLIFMVFSRKIYFFNCYFQRALLFLLNFQVIALDRNTKTTTTKKSLESELCVHGVGPFSFIEWWIRGVAWSFVSPTGISKKPSRRKKNLNSFLLSPDSGRDKTLFFTGYGIFSSEDINDVILYIRLRNF